MIRIRPLLLIPLALLTAAPAMAAATDVLAHRASLRFDLEAHRVHVEDEVAVPAGLAEIRLGTGFTIDRLLLADRMLADVASAVSLVEDEDGSYQRVDLAGQGLEGGGVVRMRYTGTFHQDVDEVVFSREKVGGEITATISADGIYLSGSAGWLPWADGVMATYDLELATPAGYETVTQGERVAHRTEGDRLVTRWRARHPSDGINLIANRYVVHQEPVRDGIVAMTFFLEDDARLRATYMERTHAYLAMYEEMIGPYPYAKFATVENWFPTGYGMPSWTLLGGQVLRLPFIPYTSFGHEIAHNWWGNSVFVDLDEGNWCEGLTVYCADYHYKEQESPAAAREYRRNTLKSYAAYVKDPAQDFPLTEFRSRHSGATRAVGYGKSMMVFHMLRRAVGPDGFRAALRAVAAEHSFTAAAWSDFLAACGEAGGADFADFGAQWLRRTGAPRLALADVRFKDDEVRFTLRQDEPVYALDVPVVVSGPAGDVEHIVRLDGTSREVKLAAPSPRKVAVDPDYHLFRHLDAAEIEPTINQVLGEEAPVFVTGHASGPLHEAAVAFARDWREEESAEVAVGEGPTAPDRIHVLLNPPPATVARLAPAELKLAGSMVFLGGRRFARKDFDLVFAGSDPAQPGTTHLVVLCDAAPRLEGLAGRISHYGKYSWLLLPAGTGRAERGNWSPGRSDLVAER